MATKKTIGKRECLSCAVRGRDFERVDGSKGKRGQWVCLSYGCLEKRGCEASLLKHLRECHGFHEVKDSPTGSESDLVARQREVEERERNAKRRKKVGAEWCDDFWRLRGTLKARWRQYKSKRKRSFLKKAKQVATMRWGTEPSRIERTLLAEIIHAGIKSSTLMM